MDSRELQKSPRDIRCMPRRRWMADVLRGAVVAVLAAASGSLLLRRGSGCVRDLGCGNCNLAGSCQEPRARYTRRGETRNS